MTRRTRASRHRCASPLRLCAGAVAILTLLPMSAADADTASATATAATVTTGVATTTSGQVSAGNDGSGAGADQGGEASLSVLAPQSLVTAGVLTQHAVARSNGTSAACAGLVGSGGSVNIAADGSCSATAGTSGGVVIALTSLVKIKADAIVASCTASSSGTTTARAQLVNAAVYTTTGLTTTSSALSSAPAAGTTVSVPAVAQLGLNTQSSTGAGNIRASALTIKLLDGSVSVVVGAVGCGPNAVVLPTPAISLQVLPLTFGVLAVAGLLWRRRRRARTLCSAP